MFYIVGLGVISPGQVQTPVACRNTKIRRIGCRKLTSIFHRRQRLCGRGGEQRERTEQQGRRGSEQAGNAEQQRKKTAAGLGTTSTTQLGPARAGHKIEAGCRAPASPRNHLMTFGP